MARKPSVTRTIPCTKATVLCMDIETCTPVTKEVTLTRTYKDEGKLLKACREVIETDGKTKVAHVSHVAVVEIRYGMSEQKFIENAEILPPLSKSDAGEETTEDTNN